MAVQHVGQHRPGRHRRRSQLLDAAAMFGVGIFSGILGALAVAAWLGRF